MSGIDRKAPVDRRASIRTSLRLSTVPGEDDNNFDLDDAMFSDAMFSDGYRPSDVTHDAISSPTNAAQAVPAPAPAPAKTQPQRPSSISKPPLARESFSLRHDGGMGSLEDSVGASSSSSAAGPAQVVRPESPYRGPSGPSFPYQMYNQDVRSARTASMSTTATAEQSYQGPSGPTHPYQLYPQNTIPEDTPERTTAPAIPVGFAMTPDTYQRRIGPDGEEIADMIGPDGHTEQLPPYTRYPDEAYQRKIAGIGGVGDIHEEASASSSSNLAGSASASTSTSSAAATSPAQASAQTMRAIPGAGGLGLATRNPEFASTEDLAGSPQSRHSMRSLQSEVSDHNINTAAMGVVNEKKPLKKWQILAKRKLWGVVPCWALTLTIIILVMLAVVLGAVLGVFFNRPKKPHDSSPTMSYDANPLATMPADLPPLPDDGSYALPLMSSRTPAQCFNDTSQAQAWNCNQVFAQLTMSIKHLQNQPETSQYSMSIDFNSSYTIEDNVYSYGMQPPSVHDVQLLLVTDVNEPGRGPAWAFEAVYNKTVIIPESLFPSPTSAASSTATSTSSKSKRDNNLGFPPPDLDIPGGTFKRKGLAKDGDKPWICRWDGTILEVFVYPNQNNSQPSSVVNAASVSSSSTTTSRTSSGSPATSTVASSTTGLADASAYASFASELRKEGFITSMERRQATATTSTSSGTATSTSDIFDTAKPSPSDFSVPFFPRVVKMEERRLAGKPSVQPYCQQFQINSDGAATPVTDSSGNIVEVKIVEIEQDDDGSKSRQRYVRRQVIDDYLNRNMASRDTPVVARDSSDMSNCGCMWWAT